MNAPITIRVADLVGPICVSTDDGQRIYDTIAPLVRSGQRVTLSFAGVTMSIAAFLNVALGQLYSKFTDAYLHDHLLISALDAHDTVLLDRVVENATAYFAIPGQFDQAWTDEVG